VIVQNNYIIDRPPVINYNERAILQNDQIVNDRTSINYNTRYSQNGEGNCNYFPPQNLGSAYYYDDYAPPLKKGQQYPSYRRPNALRYNPQLPPSSACGSDLPIKNERIDVLVDPLRGIYIQGAVKSVNQNKCDFMVSYLAPDGNPMQKSFFAIPQNG